MVIKKIKLQNFQSHKDTEILLDKGLTVILGPTDQGKSAIVRALKWVLYNEPRGTDFITAGCKTCRVSLEMSNGAVIIRERDGSKNRYILQRDGQEQVFEGFGVNVPSEITNAHGIPKIQIDTDKSTIVNLAEQLEPPFLLSETGGNRAKALGRLIGIHIIDAAQRFTLRDLVEAQQHHKALNMAIDELQKELTQYGDLHIIEAKIRQQEGILKDLRDRGALYARLSQIRSRLVPAEEEIREINELLTKLGFLESLSKYTLRAEELNLRYCCLQDAQRRFKHNSVSIDIEERVLSKTGSLLQAETLHREIIANYKLMSRMAQLKQDLKNNSVDLTSNGTIIKKTQGVFSAEKAIMELADNLNRHKTYSSIRDRIRSIDEQISLQSDCLQRTSQIVEADTCLTDAKAAVSELSALRKLKTSIVENETALDKGYAYISTLLSELNDMIRSYGLLLKQLSRCPTCLSSIDDETANKIVSELMKTSR